MRSAKLLLSALTQGLFALACLALVVMLGSYVLEVVLRYLFNAPTRWSSDVVSYAMLCSVAFALPAVTRDGGHVAITSLLDGLATGRRVMAIRTLAWVSAFTCLAAVVLLGSQATAQWRGSIETVAAVSIPKWWLSAAVALGLIGAAGHFIQHALAPVAAALGGEREL